MFVLNKKRIYIVFTCLILSTLVFQIRTANIKTQETVALPVNRKVIVIDAGHGR